MYHSTHLKIMALGIYLTSILFWTLNLTLRQNRKPYGYGFAHCCCGNKCYTTFPLSHRIEWSFFSMCLLSMLVYNAFCLKRPLSCIGYRLVSPPPAYIMQHYFPISLIGWAKAFIQLWADNEIVWWGMQLAGKKQTSLGKKQLWG